MPHESQLLLQGSVEKSEPYNSVRNTTLIEQVNLKQEKKTKRLGLENAKASQYYVSKKCTISAPKSAMENRARDE